MTSVHAARRLQRRRATPPVLGVLAIAALAAFSLLVAQLMCTPEQLWVVRPVVVIIAICGVTTWLLANHRGVGLFGEIGFVYLAIALAYTVVPAIRFVLLNVRIPLGYDNLNLAALSPTPEQIGIHYWRHVLFFAGVAASFLIIRLQPLRSQAGVPERLRGSGFAVAALALIVVGCAMFETALSGSVSTYIEHYTRFDHLPWALRKAATLSVVVRSGSYFVLLALMFSDYRRYRAMIVVITPLMCAYEIWYSFGSRIVGATILLAVFALYNLRVRQVRVLKGMAVMGLLALTFTIVGLIRSVGNDLAAARLTWSEEKVTRGDEFDAVFATSFHIYYERARGSLPPREWLMFVHEAIALIPFVDHTRYNPQYWYARHYFPAAPVPPTTMGVIAESGLWGGEIDLVLRSMINGALFAVLTRWYQRRRGKWWALTVYVYCYATCVMTLKYSVLFLAVPLLRVILPAICLGAALLWWERHLMRVRRPKPVGILRPSVARTVGHPRTGSISK